MVFIAHLSYSFSKFLFHVRAYGIWPNNMSSGREMIPCEEIRNRCRVKICRLKLYVIIQYYKVKNFQICLSRKQSALWKNVILYFLFFFFSQGIILQPLDMLFDCTLYTYTRRILQFYGSAFYEKSLWTRLLYLCLYLLQLFLEHSACVDVTAHGFFPFKLS